MPIREYNIAQPHWRGGVLVESGTVQVDENAAKYDVANGNLTLVEKEDDRQVVDPQDKQPVPGVNVENVRMTDAPETPQDALQQGDSARSSVGKTANPETAGEPSEDISTLRQSGSGQRRR